jgi:hypothetical protein
MTSGFCAFCGEISILQNSHSIPDGIFRLILKSSGGSAIAIPSSDRKIHKSNDTGKDYILCRKCEAAFNLKWDAPIVNFLKKLDKSIKNNDFTVRENFSHAQFTQAITSIIWRACVSQSEFYSGCSISNVHQAQLYKIIQSDQSRTLKNCSLSIRRLRDQRSGIYSFDQDTISQLIYPPTPRSFVINGKIKGFGFEMAFLGFLIHVIIPRLPHHKLRQAGFLKANGKVIHAPPINIFDYKPLVDMMVIGMKKHIDGHETLGVKRT